MTRVPPVGSKSAKLMIVGESPGRQELIKGEPFVGASGRYLDSLLRANGLARSEVYITNVVKTRPKGDDFFFKGGKPTTALMEGILELVEEIQEVSPNPILAFGDHALWALTQNKGIWKWRGSILESAIGPKVIPTVHPAWFIRTRMFYKFPLVEWDFARAVQESAFPEIRRPQADFITSHTPEEILSAIDRFTSADLLTVDTEWYSPENLAYIGFADSPDYAVVIPASSMQAYRAFKEILSSPVPKVIQNAAFDAVALSRIGIDIKNIRHDLMIAWHSCWTDLREKSLGVISSVLTDWPYYKSEGEFIGKDDERGQIYCAMDCVTEHESMEKILSSEFSITSGKKGYEISMSAMEPFIEASKMGILADTEKLLSLKTMYLERAEEIESVLSSMLGYTLNCRSSKQVAELVFDRFKVKRKRTTRQEILMDIAASTPNPTLREILKAIIKVRQDRNIVSRYIHEEIVDRDGRIRCNWNLAGTRSGRFSTTIPWWNGVALQTVPDDARDVFIADPGHVFVGWDLEQAEARVVAVLTHDYELLDDMERGIDIHTKLASRMPFGLSMEELLARIEEEGKDNVRERYLSKKTRHGMNYKMGPDTLKFSINREFIETNVGVTSGEAKVLHSSFMSLHPGLPAWWNEVKDTLRNPGWIENTFGRRRRLLGSLDDVTWREYISYVPQSTVADLTTISIVAAQKRMAGWGQILTHMHDGGFFQVPEERAEEAIQIVREEMNRDILVKKEVLRIPAEIKVGHTWGTLKKVS